MTIDISTPQDDWYTKKLRGELEAIKTEGGFAVTRAGSTIEAETPEQLVQLLKEQGLRYWGPLT